MGFNLEQTSAGGGSSSTPVNGFIIPGYGQEYSGVPGSATALAVANRVYVLAFNNHFPTNLKRATISVTATSAATSANVGLYDFSGNLLKDFGAMSTAASGVVTATLGATYVLPAGQFYLAAACTSVTPTAATVSGNGNMITFLNTLQPRVAFATNTLSGGALPGTLGSLTTQSAVAIWFAILES